MRIKYLRGLPFKTISMLRRFILYTFMLFAFGALPAQTPKNRVISVPVIRNGVLLREPWVGGMNAPQFSYCDLNNDGKKDLVAFDRQGNKVLTYISNGDGTDSMFEYAPQYEGLFPAGLNQFVLMRDYNNDGVPDIFTFANTYAGIRVFKGSIVSGKLHFDLVCPVIKYVDSPYTATAFVNNLDIPVITDVNRDGDLDLLSYDVFGSNVGYYENQAKEHPGDPHYALDSFVYKQVTSCWGNFSQNVNTNSISLNTSCKGGSGEPQPAGGARHAGNSIFSFEDPVYHTVDLLNGNIGYNNLLFLQNCGDSSYANICVVDSLYPLCSTPIRMPTYPAAYAVDADNDGLEDLLIAPNQTTGALDINNVKFYKNTGNINCPYDLESDSFLVHNMLDFGTDSKALFYDFNGDGLLDIIVGNYGYFQAAAPYRSTLAYYQNTGTPTQPQFTLQTTDYANFSAYQLQGVNPAFGDLNGDGHDDLLAGDAFGSVYLFTNTATTGSSYPSMTSSQYFNINVGAYAAPFIYDLNGDSLNDIIIGRQDGGISYYWNFGTKTSPLFSVDSVNRQLGGINVTAYLNSVGYSQPYIIDSSGDLKLFVGSLAGKIFEYDINRDSLRHGKFNLITPDFVGQNVGAKSTISIGDINKDGHPEYLIGNSRGGLLMYSDSVWDPGTSLGIPEVEQSGSLLHIYPNPATDQFSCLIANFELMNPQLEIFNVLGEKLTVDFAFSNNRLNVNTRSLSNGVYFVRIAESGKSWTGKLLLQK